MNTDTLPLLTWFDALLLVVALASLFSGWHRGLMAGAADLVALLASLWLAWAAGPALAAWAQGQGWALGVWALPAAVVLAYVLTRLMLGALLGSGLKAVPAQAHRHIGNRLLGLLPGAANGLIHMLLLVLLWQALPLGDTLARSARESLLARPLAPSAEWLQARLAAVFEPAWAESMRRTTVQPGTRELLELPFSVQAAPFRPNLEAQMLVLVNQARSVHGLKPVSADPDATEVARAHSRDMLARGNFSHVSPEKQDPFDRMRQGGLRYRVAGENLALAPNVGKAHEGLMNSPGHRANILRPAFGRLGIGIVDGGRYGLMVTQKFRD